MAKNLKIALNLPPQQAFTSGSVVSGTLMFDLDKPISYQYIKVSLFGQAQVQWDNLHEHHSYSGVRNYLNLQVIVWEKEQTSNGKLQPGHYDIPFEITLLSRILPPSVGSGSNSIRYWVQGRIVTGLLRFDHVTTACLPVTEAVDINLPGLQRKVRGEIRRTVYCWCYANRITLTAEVPRSGFCIGEVVPLSVTVENGSSRDIRVSVKLNEIVIRRMRDRTNRLHHKVTTRSVVSLRSGLIQANTSSVWSPGETLTISQTATPTLLSCDIFVVKYTLLVTAVVPWSINEKTLKIPLTIGNVPFRDLNLSHSSTTVDHI